MDQTLIRIRPNHQLCIHTFAESLIDDITFFTIARSFASLLASSLSMIGLLMLLMVVLLGWLTLPAILPGATLGGIVTV